MTELTTEITLKVTNIVRVPDNQVDGLIQDNAKPEVQQEFAKSIKKMLGMDNAVVTDVKCFIRGNEDGKID